MVVVKKCYKATAKTKASISQTHSENLVKAICDVKSVLKRAMQLITLNPLATMFPKDGLGRTFISILFYLGQAHANKQPTNFGNIDCCAVKKVEGTKSLSTNIS